MAAKHRPTSSQPPRPPPPNPPRRSLRQGLKDVFLRALRKSPDPQAGTLSLGSGILRRAESSSSFAPSTTTFSSFVELPGSRSSLEEYTISRAIPNRFQSTTHVSPAKSPGRQSLLPATSLSQFNLNQSYLHPSTGPQRAVHDAMSPSLLSVASRQASMASFSTLSTISSASTLRIQESREVLGQIKAGPPSFRNPQPPAGKARTKHVSWLQSPTASSVSVPDSGKETDDPSGLRLVEHFKSFCILDTAVAGLPVVATSKELRYIFEVGEHFFLNNCECEGASMDIVTGQDAAGDPVTHLVLFTPLIIPSSGRSRFMLACLIDVTQFINDTATLPELDHELDTSTIESEVQTPLQERKDLSWTGRSYKLSAEDLLGGCMLPDDREKVRPPNNETSEDIWLNLANEERSRRSSIRNTPRSTPKIKQIARSNASHTSTTSSTVDEVLDEFMSDLQELYSDFFLLGKSPLDDTCFEICNVSPLLYSTREYINGHLSRTDPQQMAELSASLARETPFNMHVKWGPQGLDKRMYCSPMYTANSITWICFLVDYQMPLIW
ncbi:uncharacterized protein Z519_09480 [Cladophialophora bantiana CBS 173.52]|uniref:Uncharacterized protein n=1 Tax=Cladophialophora bantiana (strain ATCC 10958 / CBS 173.52 / CDC B-1940 / NIH 8579) TaxID=1442370 RepID=A0A0D2HZQ8_CLAB1|nr:uncharacterized protein Z519_09480 [Cladophialophora bantiana CBS 173.52]KIW90049.1 hypothetical protein Z519_09480 [Cladophialophora bantiana CBS 173.52]